MSISAARKEARAVSVKILKEAIKIRLADGRELSVPIEWFPRLSKGTLKQRNKFRLIGQGIGIHWPELDEDISIEALL